MFRETDSVDDKQVEKTTGGALIRTEKEEQQIDPKFNLFRQIIQLQISQLPQYCQITDNNQILKRLSWAMSIMTLSRLPGSGMASEFSRCKVLSWVLMNVIDNARAPVADRFKSCHRKAAVAYLLPHPVQTQSIVHILMITMNKTMTMGRRLHAHLPFLVLTSEMIKKFTDLSKNI